MELRKTTSQLSDTLIACGHFSGRSSELLLKIHHKYVCNAKREALHDTLHKYNPLLLSPQQTACYDSSALTRPCMFGICGEGNKLYVGTERYGR